MENNLRAWREQRGLSQEDVCNILRTRYGISTVRKQHISTWERRIKTPSLEHALRLARIYNCTVEDLFPLDD